MTCGGPTSIESIRLHPIHLRCSAGRPQRSRPRVASAPLWLPQAGIYFDNAYADPTQSFAYDPLYRLIAATGREHDGLAQPTAAGFAPIAHPQDTQAQRNYLQTYTYDPVGNILRMKHVSGGVTVWHRGYDYAQDGNHLLKTSLPGDDPDDPQT